MPVVIGVITTGTSAVVEGFCVRVGALGKCVAVVRAIVTWLGRDADGDVAGRRSSVRADAVALVVIGCNSGVCALAVVRARVRARVVARLRWDTGLPTVAGDKRRRASAGEFWRVEACCVAGRDRVAVVGARETWVRQREGAVTCGSHPVDGDTAQRIRCILLENLGAGAEEGVADLLNPGGNGKVNRAGIAGGNEHSRGVVECPGEADLRCADAPSGDGCGSCAEMGHGVDLGGINGKVGHPAVLVVLLVIVVRFGEADHHGLRVELLDV